MDRLSTKGQMVDQVNLREVPHSGFDRSNHNYGTGKLGALIPCRLDEVYPGDRIKGKPEMVANFEPLVAPLMGSMVHKQESFFVPYILLWRHAYKFFTGKNGFNEPMPSISPREIYNVYNDYIHINLWSQIGSDISYDDSVGFGRLIKWLYDCRVAFEADGTKTTDDIDSGTSLFDELQYVKTHIYSVFYTVYSGRKMLDLVLPLYKEFVKLIDSSLMIDLDALFRNENDLSNEKVAGCYNLSVLIGTYLFKFFNFFHGPSSLFDYLGWPVPVIETGRKYGGIAEKYGVSNIFEYCCFMNVYNYGYNAARLNNIIPTYFSELPLVFNPFKAYYLIWYWNYRDQLLETGILDPEEDEFLGSELTENVILYTTIMRQRCWFKDTYTTSLTNTGDGNLLVPVGDEDQGVKVSYYTEDGELVNTTDRDQAVNAGAFTCEVRSGSITYKVPMNYLRGALEGQSGISKNNDTSYISLDLFDRIKRLRNYVQKRLILGYEVDDVIQSSFMVSISSVRMHVPELLGRGRDSVQINTIVNNTSTDQQIAGDKTATAYSHATHSEMNYFSEDWGLFFTISTILPVQSYAGGLQRLYLKREPLDYMWPEFATMGMDAVYNTELAAVGTRLQDSTGLMVFGYQGRYYDLKSRQDEEHGRLLTDLNYLTFSREFDQNNPPKLNYIFVHCWPRLDGFVLDDELQDVFRYDCYNAHAWERRLPVPSEFI